MAVVLAAATAACLAGWPNPHPHTIRDAEDAKATGFANWAIKVPGHDLQRLKYISVQEGRLWHLKHIRSDRWDGGGTEIWIDQKTGCIANYMVSMP